MKCDERDKKKWKECAEPSLIAECYDMLFYLLISPAGLSVLTSLMR